MKAVNKTIAMLKMAIDGRKQGGRYLNNSFWLIDMAINRRAGWQDDPGCCRGSAMPVNGHYPRKAIGESFQHLCLLARLINNPRMIVRKNALGEWRKLLISRIPARFED